MQSLVQRQFRSVVPGIVLSLLTAGVFVDVLVVKKLNQEFDELLLSKSSGLIALAEMGEEGLEVEHYETTLPIYTDVPNAEYFEFISHLGDITSKSLSLRDDKTLVEVFTEAPVRFVNGTLPDGRTGRFVLTRFLPRLDIELSDESNTIIELEAKILNLAPPGDGVYTVSEINAIEVVHGSEKFQRVPLTLILASSREKLDSLIRIIHFLLIGTGLATIGLILLAIRRGTNNAMSPLNQLADQVAELDEHRLDQKLTVNEPVEELSVLTDRFNFLLNRLQEAFTREQRFTDDMAHELRTPVSEIRTLLDVHKRWPEDEELQKSFVSDIDIATVRMQRIIENLLILTRSQNQAVELAHCDDLGELLKQRIGAIEQNSNNRHPTIDADISSKPVPVMGCMQWGQIIDNLLTNAIVYSEPSSTINIKLASTKGCGQFVLEISNDALDLEEQDLPVMFDRLWQKELSRTSGEHTGLGLALVKNYSDQVGATIEKDLSHGRFTIRLLCNATT